MGEYLSIAANQRVKREDDALRAQHLRSALIRARQKLAEAYGYIKEQPQGDEYAREFLVAAHVAQNALDDDESRARILLEGGGEQDER